MSTYLIGDIQGCWRELQQLLKKINYRPGEDRLGFVGDVLNRGPESLDVLRFVMDLDNPLYVLGNHEIYFLITARGHIPRDRYQHTLNALLDAPDCDEMIAWLRRQPLAQLLPDNTGLLVHAGVPPQWSFNDAIGFSQEVETLFQSEQADDFFRVCFGDQPDSWDNNLIGFDRIRYIINALTRMRFCTATGQLDLKEKGNMHANPETFKPWFYWRDNDPMPLYFGHWAKLKGVCDHPHFYALDTACVGGGTLTAIRVEDKQLFSV